MVKNNINSIKNLILGDGRSSGNLGQFAKYLSTWNNSNSPASQRLAAKSIGIIYCIFYQQCNGAYWHVTSPLIAPIRM